MYNTVVTGSSGSGKTTYLLSKLNSKSLYVNCNNMPLLESLNGIDNCTYVGLDRNEILEYSKIFLLDSCIKRSVNTMSDGERQRLVIMRTLLDKRFDELLLDEPTSHLNKDLAEIVMKEIVKRNCIVATNQLDFIDLFERRVDCEHFENSIKAV